MHILIVFHTTYPRVQGGINAMLGILAQQWLADGHRVSILAPSDWSHETWTTENHGAITLHRKRLRIPYDRNRPIPGFLGGLVEFPHTLWQIRKLVKDESIDVIHLHTPREYQLFFRVLTWLGGPPYVLTFHGTDARNFAAGKGRELGFMRWVARGAAAITAVSRDYARLLERSTSGLPPVYHIPNGIPLTTMPDDHRLPAIDDEAATLDHLLSRRFFIMVGWVEPPKSPDVAVRAWGLLKEKFPDLNLLIIGTEGLLDNGAPVFPGFFQEIAALIRSEGCEHTVHLTGNLEPEILRRIESLAMGLVFPSQAEGLPMVLLEAGAARLPVVCTDIPAFSDIITHGENGLLVPKGNHAALAAAVTRLVENPRWARSLGDALRDTIEKSYSSSAMANGYLELFERLCAKR